MRCTNEIGRHKKEYVHRSASYFSFQEMFSIYDYGEANEERKSFATLAFCLIQLTRYILTLIQLLLQYAMSI